jgi:hypothetical protein
MANPEAAVQPVPPNDGQDMGDRVGQLSGQCKKKVTGRSTNFSTAEDVNLCTSWVAISCDPIKNTGQKKAAFWVRVAKLYNTNRGCYPERSQKSLLCRWETIKEQVSRFSSYMVQTLRLNPSGMSDSDKVRTSFRCSCSFSIAPPYCIFLTCLIHPCTLQTSEAAARFAAVEGHPFTFMHCWNELKDEPKWMDVANKGAVVPEAPTQHTPQDSNTGDQDGSADQAGGSTGKRPMGRDAAKKKKANSSSSGGSVEYASKFHDLSLEKLGYLKDSDDDRRSKMARLVEIEEERCSTMKVHRERRLALEERKVRLQEEEAERRRQLHEEEIERQRRAEDERILGIDLDACPPVLREYYRRLQSQILDRLNM